MSRMWHVRAALLTTVGALCVHQARYLLTPPDHTHSGAHAYFAWVIPLVAILAIGALAELAIRLARRDVPLPNLPSGRVLAVVFGLTLLVVFGVQETLESLFVDGGVPRELPIVANGAWVSIPLAAFVGCLIALLLRGAALVVALIADLAPRLRPRTSLGRRPERLAFPIASGLGRRLAPRGPPFLS